jgi:thiamine pyrophosphate-dependent acetolactate synthase large subunit-like protein
MKRIEALKALEEVFGDDPLVITCGATAREMAYISKRKTHLPLLDSMGLTTPVGLGIALGHNGRVGVIDGDGSLLMGFSILPTLKASAPKNLIVVVLDNGQHASADQMLSQATAVDIAGAAEGLGLWTFRCDNENDMRRAIADRHAADAASLIFVKIEHGNAAGIPFYLADPAQIGRTFANSFTN